MAKKQPDPIAEVIAQAMNEQGFLFQFRMAGRVVEAEPDGSYPHKWGLEAVECPVSFRDIETRIDLVLRWGESREGRQVYAAVECKRSHRDYKNWVCFDPSPYGRTSYFFERRSPGEGHRIQKTPGVDSVYRFYLESKLNREKAVSSTTAIEDALRQVTLGAGGLFERLRGFGIKDLFIVPVVVTTANLYSAHFTGAGVDPEMGTVKPIDLELERRDWLPVNYPVGDEPRNLSGSEDHRGILKRDIEARFLRTVFIVQAKSVNPFLAWVGV